MVTHVVVIKKRTKKSKEKHFKDWKVRKLCVPCKPKVRSGDDYVEVSRLIKFFNTLG